MMKTTQFLTNIKFWQGIFVSFLLLVSLNLNSQNVGDDLLANSNGQVDTSSGATGSGGGCFSFGNNGNPGGTYDGVTQCGWTAASGLNYAGGNASTHGLTHSGDRMFKSYKTNGTNGEFIAQEVGELALGTYSYSFFHRWTGGAVDYTDGAPKFTIKKGNADGGWDNVLVVDLAVGETGASGAWTETAGSWENTEGGSYKIQVYKNGAANAGLAQNLHLDTFSFIYDAEPPAPADCAIAVTYTPGSYAYENSFSITSGDTEILAGLGADGAQNFEFELYFGDSYTINLVDSYGDGWNGGVLTVDGEDYTITNDGVTDDGYVATFTGACADTPKLALQGIMDGDLGGSDGKALHLVATGSISDLSAYGVGVDNNGQGSDGQEYTFEAISVEAGANILLARNPDVMTAYLAAPGVAFDHVITASSSISQNGDDAISLYHNGVLVEQYGDADVDGTGEAWEYTDSWAYKVDGAWTNGELGCMGGDTSCTSSCPYPFIADACPLIADCVVSVEYAPGSYAYENTFSITSGDNVLVEGAGTNGAQTFEFGLSYGENYTISLVDSYGDGWNGGALIVNGTSYTIEDGYDASFEGSCASPEYDVTFNLDARNIIVADDGIYMGGGIFNSAQGVAMSDDDGDGIWTAVVTLQEGTTGEFIFLNSPGDGGDYNGRTENLADTACATGQYNDRAIPAFDADNLVFNYCFSVCNDTNTGCAEAATRHDVSFTVGTANIEGGVGEGGMYLGGGIMGHAKAFAMTDNGDDTHSVTVSVPEGLGGNYVFLNNPSNHYWYDGKEDLAGLDCADGEFSDRYLEPVTEAGSVSFCYGTCDTECAAPNNGIAEFPACFDFEGEAGLDGWQFLDLADGTVGWALASASTSSSAFEGGQALYHGYLPAATNYSGLAISPQFNTSGMTDAQLSYTEFVQWASDGQDAVVWVSTDEVLSLESDNLTVVAQGISADGYTDQVIDLPEADYVTVIFQYIGTYGHSWAIDDMCVEEVPAEPNLVTADPTYEWGGYMVVFDVDGNYVFESGWDVADLQTTLNPDAPNIILEPNFNAYDADDPFWSNGEVGNKIMLATTQVESSELYNGADLTFSGSVYEHTLGEDYEAVYFIKCLDQSAGYSDMLNAEYEIPLPESGEFSVTVSGDLLPAGKLVQFGFYVQGLNANPALEYGRVVIGEPGLSIGENNSLDMVIYPNPVDGDYVTIQTPLNGDKLVEVFDVNGRKVMERLLTTDTLNVSSISAGMYIVKVTVEDQSNVSKLIIE
jgi:hypothetical protein